MQSRGHNPFPVLDGKAPVGCTRSALELIFSYPLPCVGRWRAASQGCDRPVIADRARDTQTDEIVALKKVRMDKEKDGEQGEPRAKGALEGRLVHLQGVLLTHDLGSWQESPSAACGRSPCC